MERTTYRTLGKTGLAVSPLGFGAAPIGLLDTEQAQAGEVMHALLDLGINLIDTAASYRGSEEAIGATVAQRRNEFVLVSKCGQAFEGLPGAEWSAEAIGATVDRALRRLRTDHLDVMLLHSASEDVLRKGEAIGALARARDAGKVRFIGSSGDNEAMAYAATLPDVDVIELSINFLDQANIDMVLPIAQQHNVGIIAKRPIANTAWRNPAELKGFYQGYAQAYHERFQAMGVSLQDLGFAPGEMTWLELALRFTLSLPGVHTAIIGTTSSANARANVAAAERGPLPASVVAQLRSAFASASAASAEPWPALR